MKGAEPTLTMEGFSDFSNIVHYIERTTHEIWDRKNLGLIYRYYTPTTVVHTSDGDVVGSDAVVENSVIKLAAFPDIRDRIEDTVWTGNDADGYRTSMRWTWTARNTGHSVYGPPTGRAVTVRGIANCVVRGEEIVEEWVVYNELSLIRQLGLDVREVLLARGRPAVPQAFGEVQRLDDQRPPAEMPPAEMPPPAGESEVEDLVRRSVHEVWNRRMFGQVGEYYAPNVRCHGPSDRELYGVGDYAYYALSTIAAFPDAEMQIDDLYWLDDGDGRYRTAVLWTLTGTHRGPGIYGAPTGRRVGVMGITHHRIRGGRIVEEWTEAGEFALMRALLPAEAGGSPPEDEVTAEGGG